MLQREVKPACACMVLIIQVGMRVGECWCCWLAVLLTLLPLADSLMVAVVLAAVIQKFRSTGIPPHTHIHTHHTLGAAPG